VGPGTRRAWGSPAMPELQVAAVPRFNEAWAVSGRGRPRRGTAGIDRGPGRAQGSTTVEFIEAVPNLLQRGPGLRGPGTHNGRASFMQVVSSGFNEAPGTPEATLMQIASVPISATRPGLAGPGNLSPIFSGGFGVEMPAS
jgi:hypothetical protein